MHPGPHSRSLWPNIPSKQASLEVLADAREKVSELTQEKCHVNTDLFLHCILYRVQLCKYGVKTGPYLHGVFLGCKDGSMATL